MKTKIAIGLAFWLISIYSCGKEKPVPVAVLSFSFQDRSDDVEWSEVLGNRYVNSGNLYVTANGYDTEQFHLELDSVIGTGLIANVTSKNISYSNNYGFKTGSLQSVQIRITSINFHRISGSFEAAFINRSNSIDVIKAKGEFSILGQE